MTFCSTSVVILFFCLFDFSLLLLFFFMLWMTGVITNGFNLINASQNGSEFCYTHFNIFTLSLFRVEQIGCYMGFSINASVIAFAMFTVSYTHLTLPTKLEV